MYYLYWIHIPEHHDICSQGYIGVSKQPKRRFIEHKSYKQNSHLKNAFKKYKDIVHTILLCGSEDYCYEMENKLRPRDYIGWNINIGGVKPPSAQGRKISQKHIEILRQATLNMSKESKERKAFNKAQDWKVTNPNGEVFIIHNLKKFCRENNLDQGNMVVISKGKRDNYKGWKCEKLFHTY